MLRAMRQLVWIFLWAAPAYAIAAHLYAWRLRMSQAITIGSHAATTLVAMAIAWMFLVRPGQTVAQFAAGSAEAQATFSAWIAMWPSLLILLGAGGSVHAMATLIVGFDRGAWRWLPLTFGGGAMCGLGLAATFVLAPTA